MTILDSNILLYAHDSRLPEQPRMAAWLESLLADGESIGLPWVAIWAFLRISTNPRIWSHPKTVGEAFSIIHEWLEQPGVIALSPGPRHTVVLEKVISTWGISGPLVTDAVFAALALEYGATLASTDQGFRRFPDLRWINPLTV